MANRFRRNASVREAMRPEYRGKAIRKVLSTSVRLLVTAVLIAILAQRFDLARAADLMGHVSLSLLAATLTALVAASLLVALRWHLILSLASPSPGPAALLKIVFVGLFFNQVLPTGVGGDAVRAWRCSKLGIGLGAAVRSILLDRAWGFAVLVVLYVAVLPSLLQVLPEARGAARRNHGARCGSRRTADGRITRLSATAALAPSGDRAACGAVARGPASV